MKKQIIIIVAMLAAKMANAEVAAGYQLPENGKIKVATLTGSAGCSSMGEFKPLNLNGETYMDGTYYPDLQIDFGCSGKPMLEGADLSTIAEIGLVPLETIDYYRSLAPIWDSHDSLNFRRSAEIKEGMTYSMILNTFKYRGQLVFRVVSYKNNILTIEYVTRSYSLISETASSKFIDYKSENSRQLGN